MDAQKQWTALAEKEGHSTLGGMLSMLNILKRKREEI